MTFEIEPAFVTPIYCGCVNEYDEIQSELESCIEKIEFGMVPGWGSTHWLSDPTFNSNLVSDFNLDKFATEIDIHVKNYCQSVGYRPKDGTELKYRIISSWFALFKKGNYAHIHNHGDSDIAGVYYFKKSGDDGNLFFCTPNKAIDSSVLLKTGRMVVNPTEGELLLFPGWLDHGVQTNDTDDERVSVSFNIRFEGR
tara:strand:- start:4884 stop:5474 length:591 start_codon:yes stop_codon:yes gene_type:complete